jgi:hypothetical protein
MIKDFCIVVNTVSTCSDIWEMFFNQLEKHFPNQKIYVFSDVNSDVYKKHNVILYDKNLDFRTQYYESLKKVNEEYCLNMNDDYILYDDVKIKSINDILDILKNNTDISFVRVGKGYNNTNKSFDKTFYYLDPNFPFFYSQTVAVWKTKTLLSIHELSPNSSIGRKDNLPQLEVVANDVCKSLKLNGLYHYDNELQRGSAHYDSNIFPYIASALVSGKWNLSEYGKELSELINQYNININNREKY